MLTIMFIIKPILGLFVASAIASPILPTRTIEKRASPQIASGFTAQESTQLKDAFSNALQLASYVKTSPDWRIDPILKKYFDPKDKDLVLCKLQEFIIVEHII